MQKDKTSITDIIKPSKDTNEYKILICNCIKPGQFILYTYNKQQYKIVLDDAGKLSIHNNTMISSIKQIQIQFNRKVKFAKPFLSNNQKAIISRVQTWINLTDIALLSIKEQWVELQIVDTSTHITYACSIPHDIFIYIVWSSEIVELDYKNIQSIYKCSASNLDQSTKKMCENIITHIDKIIVVIEK